MAFFSVFIYTCSILRLCYVWLLFVTAPATRHGCVYMYLHQYQLCCYGSSLRLFGSSVSLHICSAVVTRSEILQILLMIELTEITVCIRSFSRLCDSELSHIFKRRLQYMSL